MYNYCAVCNSVTEHKEIIEHKIKWVLCVPCEDNMFDVEQALTVLGKMLKPVST